MAVPRQEIIRRLRAQVTAGRPVIGCGAGTRISAKFAERAIQGQVKAVKNLRK